MGTITVYRRISDRQIVIQGDSEQRLVLAAAIGAQCDNRRLRVLTDQFEKIGEITYNASSGTENGHYYFDRPNGARPYHCNYTGQWYGPRPSSLSDFGINV